MELVWTFIYRYKPNIQSSYYPRLPKVCVSVCLCVNAITKKTLIGSGSHFHRRWGLLALSPSKMIQNQILIGFSLVFTCFFHKYFLLCAHKRWENRRLYTKDKKCIWHGQSGETGWWSQWEPLLKFQTTLWRMHLWVDSLCVLAPPVGLGLWVQFSGAAGFSFHQRFVSERVRLC